MGRTTFVLSHPIKVGMIVGLCIFGVLLIILAVYRIRALRKKYLRDKTVQQEREVYFGIDASPTPHLDEEVAVGLNDTSSCMACKQKSVNLDAAKLWTEYQNRGSIWRDAFAEMPSPEPAYLSLSIYYQLFRKQLKVHVSSAQNLRSAESQEETLNTRVKVTIDNASGVYLKKATKTIERSNNPEYDQILVFLLPPEELKEAKLQASVWRIDDFFEEHLMGYVSLQLKDFEMNKRTSVLERIRREVKCDLEGGFLLVSLSYQEESERLCAITFKAKDLKSPTADLSPMVQQINPYIRVHLLLDGKIIKSGRTETKRDTANPTYNQLFQFTLSKEQLKETDILMILLTEHQDLETREKLGKVVIGAHSAGSKKEHWEAMLMAEGRPVAQWHMLEQ